MPATPKFMHARSDGEKTSRYANKTMQFLINTRSFIVSFGANTAASYIGVFGVLLGSSPIEMGMLQALSNSISNAGQILWGRVSDRSGVRRPWLMLASGAMTVIWIAMALVRSPIDLILVYSIMSLISAMLSVNWFSLLADMSKSGSRGTFLSLLNNISSLGNLMSLLAMTFILRGSSINELIIPFSMGAVAYVASVFLVLFMKEEKKKAKLSPSFLKTFAEARKNSTFYRYFKAMNIQGFFWSMAWPIFPITIVSVMNFSLPTISELTAVNIVAIMVIQKFIGKITDRFDRTPLIFVNRFLLGFIPLMYGYFTGVGEFMIIEFYSGIVSGLQNVVMNSYLMDIIPIGHRAEYVSIMNGFNGIVYLAGSLAGGGLLEYFIGIYPLHYAVTISLTIIAIGRISSSFLFLHLKEPTERGKMGNPILFLITRINHGLPSGNIQKQR
ncbi:MAG: MFS transporter [Thermoplasmata archaeon]